jgi:RNA polymerase sigma factor (TIGR02999 family)
MDRAASDDFTVLLNRAWTGDPRAAEAVWSRAYLDLHQMARGVRPARPVASVSAPGPTEIIHEAFVKVFRSSGSGATWDNRAHFFGSVARAMTQFLVDWRRASGRLKHGGGSRTDSVGGHDLAQMRRSKPDGPDGDDLFDASARDDLLSALEWLRSRAPDLADVVCIRYMAGLSLEDTALVLGISPRSVSKRWNLGRAMLRRRLRAKHGPDNERGPDDSIGAREE